MENENKKTDQNPDLNTDNQVAHNLKSDATHKAEPEKNQDHNEDLNDNTDKYLAMEQQGVTYTAEKDFALESDKGGKPSAEQWQEEGGNTKNSDAFNQDEYILSDNIDLDEDQNQSISSDDDDFEELNERY